MANIPTAVTVDEVTDAIVAGLQARLGVDWTVEAYPEDRDTTPVPWCTVELTEITTDEDNDPMTEASAQTLRFRARLIVDGFASGAKRLVRMKASDLILWLRNNAMGLTIGEARVIGSGLDDFTPELEEYEVWYLDWTHVVNVGPGIDDEDPTASFPTEVYAGIAPEIGPPHVDDYTLVYSSTED